MYGYVFSAWPDVAGHFGGVPCIIKKWNKLIFTDFNSSCRRRKMRYNFLLIRLILTITIFVTTLGANCQMKGSADQNLTSDITTKRGIYIRSSNTPIQSYNRMRWMEIVCEFHKKIAAMLGASTQRIERHFGEDRRSGSFT
jgi:hypothetical protein